MVDGGNGGECRANPGIPFTSWLYNPQQIAYLQGVVFLILENDDIALGLWCLKSCDYMEIITPKEAIQDLEAYMA